MKNVGVAALLAGLAGPLAAADFPMNSAWTLEALGERGTVETGEDSAPHLVLGLDGAARFAATVGCNRMMGRFDSDGARLVFGPVAATMMACPPELDTLERGLVAVLDGTERWRIEEGKLHLVAGDTAIAVFAPFAD